MIHDPDLRKMEQHTRTATDDRALLARYERAVEAEVNALASGARDALAEIGDLARILNVQPQFLSRTVKQVSGRTPCDIYEERLMELARQLLLDKSLSAAEVGRRLTMDPSNFGKFFKRFQGCTPGEFRRQNMVG